MSTEIPNRPIKAYGDREGDGMVQLSFVLRVPPSARAREAAKRFAAAHGLDEPLVTTMEEAAVVPRSCGREGGGLIQRIVKGRWAWATACSRPSLNGR
jgi:hypothetical protein